MNSLSLHAVNASSSYEVSAVNDGCYQFFTDYGVHCTVEFVLDDSLLSHETYHLVIVNVNHQKSPSDVKVRDTIIAIIDEFFVENNTTLLYICETGDKKQALRNRLFERWHRNNLLAQFEALKNISHHPSSIKHQTSSDSINSWSLSSCILNYLPIFLGDFKFKCYLCSRVQLFQQVCCVLIWV